MISNFGEKVTKKCVIKKKYVFSENRESVYNKIQRYLQVNLCPLTSKVSPGKGAICCYFCFRVKKTPNNGFSGNAIKIFSNFTSIRFGSLAGCFLNFGKLSTKQEPRIWANKLGKFLGPSPSDRQQSNQYKSYYGRRDISTVLPFCAPLVAYRKQNQPFFIVAKFWLEPSKSKEERLRRSIGEHQQK